MRVLGLCIRDIVMQERYISYYDYMICISSLRFHNGLTHFLAFRDNQEKLNYRAIRQEIHIIIVLLTCIGTKIKRCTKIKGQGHSL